MNNQKANLLKCLPSEYKDLTAEEIVDSICSNIYEPDNVAAREAVLESPGFLRDILLLIDLDTELTMNGILGFLENSSGRYLAETIEALKHIGAAEDARILEHIKQQLEANRPQRQKTPTLHEISSFQDRYILNAEVLDGILREADGLYLNTPDRNIFDNLIHYLSQNRHLLDEELGQYSK
ncbi:DMP19 family protein [Paenibacillus sp. BAC0078]